MKLKSTLLTSLIGLSGIAHAGVVPVTGITGHDGGNWPSTLGHLTDMVNATNLGWATTDHNPGINTSAAPNNPALWVNSSTNWNSEWLANSRLNPATSANSKIGWVVMDFGSVKPDLENMYLWNCRNNVINKEDTRNFNIYYSSGVGINALPARPNSKTNVGDYNFSSGDWTQLGTTSTLASPSAPFGPNAIIDLQRIAARYIGIEILTAENGTGATADRVGLAQVEFTQAVADNDPPTLAAANIVDNKGGASVDVNTKVTYTLTFSEDINAATVNSIDFSNAGNSAITIGAITETSPGVFTVEVTPTTIGTLRLQIPTTASIADAAGNLLDSDPAIQDDETLTVNPDSTAPTLTTIADDQGGGPVEVGSIVIYAVTFSEDINGGTVSSADFSNAGTSVITFGLISETSPGVFTVQVTPTDEGTLRLQIPASASITDAAGIPLDNDPAILDDTTLTVVPASSSALVEIVSITGSHGGDQYANGMVSLTNGSGITRTDPDDPSTWTMNGSGYQEEWMATYLKIGADVTPGLNGKVAWTCLDFGSKTPLGMLYLFNTNYSGGTSSTDQFNLYYADSPVVGLPAQPVKGTFATTGLTPQADYNFSGGGWTLFNTSGPLTATKAGITSLNLPGVSARYLAIEILSNQGDSYTGGRVGFDEIAITVAPLDSDGDGLPDAYELANTDPPSTTALDPAIDYEPDGLTTWQEYVLGTDPKDPDTDGDGLNDGPETLGVGSRPRTNPLLADTDGDGLSDFEESNTGVWGGAANPGTDPTKADTDGDGLNDKVETNTGIYVSNSNTGTNPLNPDSDGDGASDWYEVVIIDKNPALGDPPNSPNDSALKPNIPYPLPDPDTSTGATDKPVKVYIMSGQSNMVGFGQLAGTGPGTLQRMTTKENKFPNLVGPGGTWTTRNDVRYRGVVSDPGDGPLRPDVAGDKFGPELGFGYAMGWYHDEPVLLIKSSQGNRSLMWDILPPGSPPFPYTNGRTYAGYGQSSGSWLTDGGAPSPGIWYAGRQYDDFFKAESDLGCGAWTTGIAYVADGNLGSQVTHNGQAYICKLGHTSNTTNEPGLGAEWSTYWNVYSITNVADVLDGFATQYSQWASQGFEIAGFVWWQGYGDQGEPAATRYRANMARFIQQIRAYYESRYPGKGAANAPFVLATLAADGGWNNPNPLSAKVAQAQLDVAGDVPNVKTIEARSFWRDASISPSGQGYHYNWNAETYLLTGDALGRAMIDLQENVTPPGSAFDDWADDYPGLTTRTPSLDFDGGGLDTGIEWVVGGNPTIGSDDAGLAPTIDRTNPDGKLRFIFRRTTAAKNDTNTAISAQYGSNLDGWTNAVHQGTGATEITITEETNGFGTGIDRVTVALPASFAASGKLFARLSVSVTAP
jgi:Carbohydrate esterase, sialic acid-specific acetylesterase/Bacterial TSP3 repeat